jgi:outer membrane protein W
MRHARLIFAFALLPIEAWAADSGVEFGIRSGAIFPSGGIKPYNEGGGDAPLADRVSSGALIQGDLGYRFRPEIYVGLYASYSFPSYKFCQPGEDCSARMIRAGGNVQYHFVSDIPVDPWIGIGFGYEWLTLRSTSTSRGVLDQIEDNLDGFELVNFQAGIDFAISSEFRLGPTFTFSLGQYRHEGFGDPSVPGGLSSGSIGGSLHQWFLFGIRLSFLP